MLYMYFITFLATNGRNQPYLPLPHHKQIIRDEIMFTRDNHFERITQDITVLYQNILKLQILLSRPKTRTCTITQRQVV